MDASEKDSGRLVGLTDWLLSAFDLSGILPIGSGLLVLHSLPGPPIVSVSDSPNNFTRAS